MGGRRARRAVWADVATAQSGVVSRRQLLSMGLTSGAVAARLDIGRWLPLLPGVYLVAPGAPPDDIRSWAAVLYAGDGAALCGAAALWSWGIVDRLPEPVMVCVPQSRRVRSRAEVRVVTRADIDQDVHPAALPPRQRVEAALLDAAGDCRTAADVVALVLRAVQGGHTTSMRLRRALDARSRQRHRGLLLEVLTDVDDGVRSMLERRWARDVDRAHRLPGSARNVAQDGDERGRRRRRYRDVEYTGTGLVVELDGREAHPEHLAFRDRDRDNALAQNGMVSLRYGWTEVVTEPCAVAEQVVTVLRRLGWIGRARRCRRPGCRVASR